MTTSEIIIAPSTWPGDSPTISEIKLYHYDSLKSDVASLFKDDLMLELSEGVTQEKIDELINRAKTIDPESMEYHPDQDQLLKDLQRAQDLLNDINLRGTTVVVATHAKDIVDKMNKRVIRIDQGNIVRDEKGGYDEI